MGVIAALSCASVTSGGVGQERRIALSASCIRVISLAADRTGGAQYGQPSLLAFTSSRNRARKRVALLSTGCLLKRRTASSISYSFMNNILLDSFSIPTWCSVRQ